jgi:photosystem II stability/assembly factor-like uncharacterized protein
MAMRKFWARRPAFWGATIALTAHGATWVPSGPRGDFNSAIGEQCNGRIASIQVLSTEVTTYLYVGGSSGGLWRANLFAQNIAWSDLGQNLPNPSVGAFVVKPDDISDILVGTGEWQRYPGLGMYHTTNSGASWQRVPISLNPVAFFRMAYLPGSTTTALAASSSGLVRSENGAAGPWPTMLVGCVSDFVFHPLNSNVLFAAVGNAAGQGGPTGGGIYKSYDAGKTWTNMTLNFIKPNLVYRASVAICRNSPDILVAAWAGLDKNGYNIQAVLKSTDGGTNWSDISGILAGAGAGQSFHVLSTAIAPTDANQIYVGSADLWRSVNGGSSWTTSIGLPISHHADISQLYVNPLSDVELFICNDGGVYDYFFGDASSTSLNGDNVTGLQVSQSYNIDARGQLRFLAMQDDEIAGSIDGGSTWKSFHTDPAYLVDGAAVVITDASSQNPVFWCVSGSGGSRDCVRRGTFNSSQFQNFCPNTNIGTLFFDRFSGNVFNVTLESKVVSYPASGVGSPTVVAQTSPGFAGITGSPLDGQTLYIWANGAASMYNVAALRWSGQSWNLTSPSLIGNPGETNGVQQIVASKKWSGEAWAVLNAPAEEGKIFHTMDYGTTWTDISGDLRPITILSETFEGNFPADNGWSVGDDNSGAPFWASENAAFGGAGTHSGTRKVYCAGSAYPVNSSEPNPVYQNSMTAFMQRNINLVGLDSAQLRFWYKIPSIESGDDHVRVLIDGYQLWDESQPVSDWTEQVIDLTRFLGDTHLLRFEFTSDYSLTYEGCYLDDISLTGNVAVNTLAASPFDSKELYIGTDAAGVFRTLDGGQHWQPFQDRLPLVSVTDIHYLVDESHAATDRLVIGTYGRGMYQRDLVRPGPVYVNQLNFAGLWNGTIEFPYQTIDTGITNTPAGGYLLLNGNTSYPGARTLSKAMSISAYQFPALLGK